MYQIDLNTPKAEFEQRIFNLQKYLEKENIDGALILQLVDLFYFTGTIQQAHLYLPAKGNPVLMVRKSFERAKAESSIKQILHLDRSSNIPDILKANGHNLPGPWGWSSMFCRPICFLVFKKFLKTLP